MGALLLFCSSVPLAEDKLWQDNIDKGNKLQQQGRYAQAESAYSAALAESERFGPDDPRMATSQSNLAALYHVMGRYNEAEGLNLKALALYEKHSGPTIQVLQILLTTWRRFIVSRVRFLKLNLSIIAPWLFGKNPWDPMPQK